MFFIVTINQFNKLLIFIIIKMMGNLGMEDKQNNLVIRDFQ